ncbi:DUF1802 family protein [Singulisphaera acidiphila]|uniref:DUF1802 family protein n=1 Tax=Singulisphaera acidiphila (strain ATCC BAA-1392 / DSM 18658 / VKM B-2454 / MOB10) TaxID=886293 RepID=L0DDQ6_SINAD|nr:DUF1802 family protein [Singulisphaera acidiphila]AGA27000.1 hypothetical protein Sinac_2702 [Singulisphaera acidiphila DSM 18658]
MRPVDSWPLSCGIAFKEWAGVCEALTAGRQSLILRKGGIAEGPGGFVPEQSLFWLYPTHVHEAEQGLRIPRDPALVADAPAADVVEVRTLVETGPIWWLDRSERLAELEEFHVWNEESVERRFQYRKPGLWVLGVRVYRREQPWLVGVTPEQAGCKSWVPLDPALETDGVAPVLGDQEYHRVMDHIRSLLNHTER